jgi:hypothetical protein
MDLRSSGEHEVRPRASWSCRRTRPCAGGAGIPQARAGAGRLSGLCGQTGTCVSAFTFGTSPHKMARRAGRRGAALSSRASRTASARVVSTPRSARCSRSCQCWPSARLRGVREGGGQPLTTGWSRRGDPRRSPAPLCGAGRRLTGLRLLIRGASAPRAA